MGVGVVLLVVVVGLVGLDGAVVELIVRLPKLGRGFVLTVSRKRV